MLPHILLERLQEAVRAVRPDADPAVLQVRPAADPRFGDYQTSSLIALAKAERQNPRQLADAVRAQLQVSDLCADVQVAGAGFLNFFLSPAAVTNLLAAALRGEHLFFRKANPARTFVIDFSSPNVAKPMHVGHIRSTILGDCLARNLRLLEHRVITDNHIGDWGTQFGMLLAYLQAAKPEVMRAPDTLRIEDLETFYRAAKERFDQDPDFRELARRTVVELQSGDPQALELWRAFCRESLRHCQEIYAALDVRFDYALGESFYNSRLPSLVRELQAAGLARESEGAIVVFFDDQPDLKAEGPAIIQKRDGGFNYTTTDLATLEYRVAQWAPDEIVYVTDGRQQLHFKQLFNVYRRWQPDAGVKLVHVWFGSILGEDGKPFKTRSGENVKLHDLLAEAIERAFEVVSKKNPDLPADARREIARVVGIGAVKYADLLPNRQSDYVFSWDKILALQGNAAPYLQYSYSRIQSIYRKAEEPLPQSWDDLALEHPDERALAAHLLNFGFTLEAVVEEYRPNYLCNYLYELSSRFARFFENCPVLRAAPPARTTRLGLCRLTAQVLGQGLNVLGIQTVDRM